MLCFIMHVGSFILAQVYYQTGCSQHIKNTIEDTFYFSKSSSGSSFMWGAHLMWQKILLVQYNKYRAQ